VRVREVEEGDPGEDAGCDLGPHWNFAVVSVPARPFMPEYFATWTNAESVEPCVLEVPVSSMAFARQLTRGRFGTFQAMLSVTRTPAMAYNSAATNGRV
jgi:hypothetical protein